MSNDSKLKILFIEDLPSDVDLAILELRREKLEFDYISLCTQEELLKSFKEFNPDLVISDFMMPGYDGLQALKDVKALNSETPFILYTGSINEEIAVKCIKAGAVDYVIKEHMTRLPFAVKEALEQARIKKEKKASDLLLRESEKKIQSIFRAAPVGIGLVVDRVFIEVNDTFCTMTGYSRQELIGNNSEMIYYSHEDYEFVGQSKYRQISTHGTGTVETRFKRKDGSIVNVIMSSTPLDVSNLSKGVTFTALDITDRIKVESSLRLSEEKFRSIAENLSDIIFITDASGVIKYISPSCKMFGYSPEEFNGRFFGDFLESDEKGKAMQIFNNALNSINLSSIVSLTFKRKDGSSFYAELSGSVFNISNDEVGVLGLVRDVTDRMNKDIELRKLYRAVEQSPTSILITDTRGNMEYVNSKLCEITGYSKEELIGKNPRIFSSGERNKDDYRILWDTILEGNDWKGEFHNKKKNGDLYWESASISPIKNEKEEIIHFLGIKEDITLRKSLEESIIENEKRYRELFLNNPVPTYIFDETTLDFVEVNDATVENYGFSREEFASMTLRNIRNKEDIPDLLESVLNLGPATFHSTSMRHRKKDGTVFPVELTSHSLPVKNGRKTRLVMATDITDRLKAAEQMTLAREKAEASDKLKTTFLNNISHEVRTPLNGILGFAEIINQPGLSEEERKDSILMLFQSTDRLLNTITSYMDISLLTSGNMSVLKKEFNPSVLLRDLYDNYNSLCQQKGLELNIDIPGGDENILIHSDQEIVRKMISHLIDNAVKFTEKGSISFGYSNSGTEIVFFVRDTGIGIEAESLNMIFEKFIKEERGPFRVSEGSGLGLSITKGLIELLGGTINVETESSKGSCFTLTLPLGAVNGAESGRIAADYVGESANLNTFLIAEDDETNYFYLSAILSRKTEAKLLHARNGREAVDLFVDNPEINLVLMDIKMPEMDGLEATRQIKGIRAGIPVIAITAYVMAGDEERVMAAGCDGYISKPVNRDKLLMKIAEFVKLR